jgi:uncharacterized SAM-binding protein YcdF (DUF218 family)
MAPQPAVSRELRRLAWGMTGALAAAWLAGFVVFAVRARHLAPPPPRADAIVVLTGGADRITTGLRLLADDRAGQLLVSGVAARLDLAELAHHAGLAPALLEGRVTLGHAAASTRGNAFEAARWIRQHHFRSLILVTATYHMPRAEVEFARALPNVALYPATVLPPAMRTPWQPATLRLLSVEYSKYLVAAAGLTGILPPPLEEK